MMLLIRKTLINCVLCIGLGNGNQLRLEYIFKKEREEREIVLVRQYEISDREQVPIVSHHIG